MENHGVALFRHSAFNCLIYAIHSPVRVQDLSIIQRRLQSVTNQAQQQCEMTRPCNNQFRTRISLISIGLIFPRRIHVEYDKCIICDNDCRVSQGEPRRWLLDYYFLCGLFLVSQMFLIINKSIYPNRGKVFLLVMIVNQRETASLAFSSHHSSKYQIKSSGVKLANENGVNPAHVRIC